ncbi:hypothetical protein Anacy_3710 [Anabaena cylindrica PCC 7122]|uniref:Uncharacterized protein n=1 Tax=Anabaena cylindrica (strain ATCC 27899 / PCC 7122) TaxID=272123 RepID=K9ZKK8_ANACC|nr:hypothetical protein Anacy_3710 [Anabaena cylindrica PCC 7122]BAY03879.1 hypothetical protein NIES19_31350 [Anabaena cylindrica PCC 7122]
MPILDNLRAFRPAPQEIFVHFFIWKFFMGIDHVPTLVLKYVVTNRI